MLRVLLYREEPSGHELYFLCPDDSRKGYILDVPWPQQFKEPYNLDQFEIGSDETEVLKYILLFAQDRSHPVSTATLRDFFSKRVQTTISEANNSILDLARQLGFGLTHQIVKNARNVGYYSTAIGIVTDKEVPPPVESASYRNDRESEEAPEAIIGGSISGKHSVTGLPSSTQQVKEAVQRELNIKQNRILKRSGAENANRFMYNAENVTFVDCAQEYDYLVRMCEESDLQFCWSGICGNAGSGKTRLAYELCKHMEEQGWKVYYPCHARVNIQRISAEITNLRQDMLICFDDSKIDMDTIIDFIRSCSENPITFDNKIRLILIDRDFGDTFTGAYDIFFSQYRNESNSTSAVGNDGFICTSKFAIESIKTIICGYSQSTVGKQPDEKALECCLDVLESIGADRRPLFALFVADAWCSGIDIKMWDRASALDMIVSKEFARINSVIRLEYDKKSEQSRWFSAVQLALVISSIIKEVQINQIAQIVDDFYHLDVNSSSFSWILKELSLNEEGKQGIHWCFPDLISEYLCIEYINSLERQKAVSLFQLILQLDCHSVLLFIEAAEKDYPDLLTSPSNLSVLQILRAEFEVHVGEQISEGLSEEQLHEFNQIADLSKAAVWLNKNRPDCRDIVISQEKTLPAFFYGCINEGSVFEHKSGPSKYNGDYYEGDFVLGLRCGKGKLTVIDDGTTYEGEWNNDLPNGRGIEHLQSGVTYDGEWKDGKHSGTGVMIWPSGVRYEGKWKDGVRSGEGVIIWPDGACYDGEWKGDKPSGKGVMIWPSGERYDGKWKDGMRSGEGAMIWQDGAHYEGMWRNGVRHGTGVHRYANGETYEGAWKDDKRCGFGVLRGKDGIVSSGEWKDDELVIPDLEKP